MQRLSALMYFALSLFGCDSAGTEFVHHTRADGVDTLHATASARSGVARFECRASESGRCHYAVYDTGCTQRPLRTFALAAGASRQITGLHTFDVCVGSRPGRLRADCAERLQSTP